MYIQRMNLTVKIKKEMKKQSCKIRQICQIKYVFVLMNISELYFNNFRHYYRQ